MAKTVKRETKKQTGKKTTPKTETLNIDNEKNDIVNENNEIIYNPEEELDKIIQPLNEKTENFEFKIDDDIQEALTYLNDNAQVFANMNTLDENTIKEISEEKIEELTEIKEKLEKNLNKNKYNFTSFWNGVSTNF